jgi:two-component system, OmpR family, sensor kinase
VRTGLGIRGLRGRLLLAVVVAVVAGVAVLTGGFNLALRARLDSDANELLRARAGAQLATLSIANGRLQRSEAPDDAAVDAQVWVFAGRRALERPRSAAPALARAALALSAGPRQTRDVAAPETRLLAVPVTSDGRRLGTLVVGTSLEPYEHSERVALIASLIVAGITIAGVALLARWLLGAALRPVARMTADAAAWSETDMDRRFGLGPPTDELTRLAATLDGLLDRLAGAMRREQRLSSELSHELRTPLARISTQAQLLAGADELPEGFRSEARAIVRAAAEMGEVIELLMTAARAEAQPARAAIDVTAAARAAIAAARQAGSDSHVELELHADAAVHAAAEPKLVERTLAPLIDNACRLARSRASLSVARRGGWAEIVVADDGAGIAPGSELAIFEPGYRGDSGNGGHGGAGLGLALARRLARSAGGEVVAQAGAAGGRFVVRIPAAG